MKTKLNTKQINLPERSEKLAEFVGIVLGDGNIHQYRVFVKGKSKGSNYAVRIAGDSVKDIAYIGGFVPRLIESLFGIKPSIYKQPGKNELFVIVSRKIIVEFLIEMGLKSGNKIKNQTTIPAWIWKNEDYLKACLRGLIDTDGSIYELKPNWPGLFQLTFENWNVTLLRDTRKAFLKLGFKASQISGNRTEFGTKFYLTRKDQIAKFYKEIGFSNPRKQQILMSAFL